METLTKCECGNEILQVDYWEEENEFCFCMFRYMPLRYSFGRRLKFLFAGQVNFNEIIITPAKAKEIADYINSNINNNGKEEGK